MSQDAHSLGPAAQRTERAERVERLCRAYDRGDLDESLAAAGAEEAFLAAIDLIRGPQAPAEELDLLLDELDDALAQVGLHALTRPNRVFRTLPPFERSREHVWVCPMRRCTRVETRDPGGRGCSVAGRRLERLAVD
jgi:hypothetical protein